MKVIILAAGYGTRLYPLTEDQPKPLLLVDNKPILNHIIEKIINLKKIISIDEVILISNDKFFDHFKKWSKNIDLDIEIINDGTKSPQDRLGAIKDIAVSLKGRDDDDCLVLGGDNLFEDDLRDFVKFAMSKRPCPSILIYDLLEKTKASRFGVVSMTDNNEVVEIEEKPADPKTSIIGTCVYYFPKGISLLMNKFFDQTKGADESGKFIAWLIKQDKVFGYYINGKWLDIGHKDALEEAERIFSDGKHK
ncbi:MAG: nucleotidyltransferase family protein [Candidatus Omnitrophica bacterium]|nr:nucleotidyltransferase family protein [Candidatus Omnitrophota bacterium]MDD5080817.1 nucleotidyltransferase family protein [Candidatus Omnitrophota bacterium]MDD5441238.1 nucleotidyltransferase family protein [Candidatus Omnitrophota bacterium]